MALKENFNLFDTMAGPSIDRLVNKNDEKEAQADTSKEESTEASKQKPKAQVKSKAPEKKEAGSDEITEKTVKKENPTVAKSEESISSKAKTEEPLDSLKNYGETHIDLSIMPEKKATMSVRKSFLTTPERAEKLDNLAKMRGQSVNALLNDILQQILNV